MELAYTTDVTVAIRAYINTVLKNDPLAFEQTKIFLSEREQRQQALRNERGMSEGEEFKAAISMPELLGAMVFKQFPEILSSKNNMYRFMKAFPEFTTAPKAFKTKYDPR